MVEVPKDYFNLSEDEKKFICYTMLNHIITIVKKKTSNRDFQIDMVKGIIDDSIHHNVENELYEVAAVFNDIKKYINEEPD